MYMYIYIYMYVCMYIYICICIKDYKGISINHHYQYIIPQRCSGCSSASLLSRRHLRSTASGQGRVGLVHCACLALKAKRYLLCMY